MTFTKRLVSTIHNPLLFLFLFISFALFNVRFVSTSTSKIAAQSGVVDKRAVQIEHSSHMPEATTVAISAIRNLQSEQWHRDLEIEVQNNSGKPIYYLQIDVSLPDIDTTQADGVPRHYAFPLIFGRRELMKHGNYALATDRAISPGGREVFRIPEPYWKGLQNFLSTKNLPMSAVKDIRLRIHSVSFGDGTGFRIGMPFSFKQGSVIPLNKDQQRYGTSKVRGSRRALAIQKISYRVSSKSTVSTASSLALPQLSCGGFGSGCEKYAEVVEGCPIATDLDCQKQYYPYATASTPPDDILCIGHFDYGSHTCTDSDDIDHTCTFDTAYDCEDWLASGI